MTTALDPTLLAALQADAPLVAFAVEMIYPTFAVRLVDGAGQVTIGGNTFLGRDPTYGYLNGPDTWEDGTAAEAPHLTFQICPPTLAAASALAASNAQGSTVNLYFVAVSRATGAPIGTPYLLWTGDIDVPTLLIGQNTRVVKIDAESAWDRFFDTDEGLLLTNACHQAFWPGELGLEYVTEIQAQIPWGQDISRPVVVTDVLNGYPDYTTGKTGGASGGVGGAIGGGFRLPSIPF